VPTALLSGTLTAAKWATATAFPASRVGALLFPTPFSASERVARLSERNAPQDDL
jgi:hypothetical protein